MVTAGLQHRWRGIVLAVLVALSAAFIARWIGEALFDFDKSPVSSIMVAILMGMLIANTVGLSDRYKPGLTYCTSVVLKLGIVLLGIRLSLSGVGQFVVVALPFVIAAILAGLLVIRFLGRLFGLSNQLAGLIAVGTSICGCTAIVATAPLVKSNESEVSYAVVCITVFGLAAMFAYPFVAQAMFADDPVLAGLFLGTSIHETAQVAGAGLIYEAQFSAPVALDIATVTKLTRNLCMIAIIPLIAFLYRDERPHLAEERQSLMATMPWFIVGFALMAAIRSVGDIGERAFGVFSEPHWQQVVAFTQTAAESFLLIAMSAVGLTSLVAGITAIGWRAFSIGLFAAVFVGGVSLFLIANFGTALVAYVM